MTIFYKRTYPYYLLLISLLVITIDYIIVKSNYFSDAPDLLTYAMFFDCMVLIPGAYYFLIVRKSTRKATSLLPIVIFGYIIASFLIPQQGQSSLTIMQTIVVFIELLFMIYVLFTLYRFRQTFTGLRRDHHIIEACRKAITKILGNNVLSGFIVFEISIWYYAFFSWKHRTVNIESDRSYPYLKQLNYPVMIVFFTKIIIIETIAIHLFVMQWSNLVAWLISLGDLYLIIFLIADYRAMKLNPIMINDKTVKVHYGLHLQTELDIKSISRLAEYNPININKKTSIQPLFGEPNLTIYLKEKVLLNGFFGRRKYVDQISFQIDDPKRFQRNLDKEIGN